jgi:hypothetical protein
VEAALRAATIVTFGLGDMMGAIFPTAHSPQPTAYGLLLRRRRRSQIPTGPSTSQANSTNLMSGLIPIFQ